MRRFYSPSTGTTYLAGLHQEIPDDAKVISQQRFEEVICNPDPAKIRSHDDEGLPILIDRPDQSESPTVRVERNWRDNELNATQWLIMRFEEESKLQLPTTNTDEELTQLLVYRQALRAWPQSGEFPDRTIRPVAPSWIATQSQ